MSFSAATYSGRPMVSTHGHQQAVPPVQHARKLLPAVSREQGTNATFRVTTSAKSDSARLKLPKRSSISVACGACRKSKIRCDGGRPICAPCRAKALKCVYREPPTAMLQRRLGELGESAAALQIFRAIQSRGEHEASEIFRRIRAGEDPECLMRQVASGDLLLQLRLRPETRLRFDFPYISQMPAHLRRPDNPYLLSVIHEFEPDQGGSPTGTDHTDSSQAIAYLKPYQTSTLCDARLDKVKPSRWTSVSTDDFMMRAILEAYFRYDYAYFTFFHVDLFLDDMVAGHGPFCSALLVNAILAAGCHCFDSFADRAESWNPRSLTYKFITEAKRLWELDTSPSTLLTKLQATMLINALYNVSGIDKIGNMYLLQAAAMVHDLSLFKSEPRITCPRTRLARDFTAWCYHWWQSIICYAYRRPPIFKDPPEANAPDPVKQASWYGELRLRYPQSPANIDSQHGKVMKAKFDFACVLSIASSALFGHMRVADDGSNRRAYNAVILRLVDGFSKWYETLPESLAAENIVFPSQLKLHLHYHNVLIELQNLLSVEHGVAEAPASAREAHLRDVMAKSDVHFETLLRLYYMRHSYEMADLLMSQFLTIFAMTTAAKLDAMSGDLSDARPADSTGLDISAARSALILAEKGLRDQGKSYYFPQTVFHVVLSRLRPEDAGMVRRYADVRVESDEARQMRALHIHSQYPVDTMNIMERLEGDDMSGLVKQYAELTISESEDLAPDASSSE